MRMIQCMGVVGAGALLILASGCASESRTTDHRPQTIGQQSTDQKTQSHEPSLTQRAAELAQKTPPAPFEEDSWQLLFNGTNLSGWAEANYGGAGEIEAAPGVFVMGMGEPFTGIRYTNEFANTGYEIALDAMRLMGSDFFCALTVPVSNTFCTLIVGGWGGSLVGISSLNGLDASENETTKFMNFEKERWYRIRMRVTPGRLEAWIDKDKVVDVVISAKLVTLRPGEIEVCKPLGIATWQTAAAFREIRTRTVDGPADPPPKRAF